MTLQDLFTVRVGNLPANATVVIKITYVGELQTQGDAISFRLPDTVAPWKRNSLCDIVNSLVSVSSFSVFNINNSRMIVTVNEFN